MIKWLLLGPDKFLDACISEERIRWDECSGVVQGAYELYLQDRLITDYRLHADDDCSDIWDDYCNDCAEHNKVLFLDKVVSLEVVAQ